MHYKHWVIIATGLFVLGLGAGLIISAIMPAGIVDLLSRELSAVAELGATLAPFQVTTALFIYFKNVSVLLFSFILSPVLCFMPVIALLFNGTLISFVSVIIVRQESIGLLLSGLLPHGIFEIPAIIIGEAAALGFGAATITALLSRESKELLPAFKKNLRYLFIGFALLVPAAIIETFVTPLLLQ